MPGQFGNCRYCISLLRSGHAEVAKALLQPGADPNDRAAGQEKSLRLAAQMWYGGVIKLLLYTGVDVSAKERVANLRRSALQWASVHERVGAIKLLLEARTEINCQEVNGKTALHWAV